MEQLTEWESFEHINAYDWEMAERSLGHDDECQDKDAEYKDVEGENAEDGDVEDGNSEAEDEWLAEEAMLIEAEYHMEPPRPPAETRVSPDQDKDLPQSLPTFWLRGGHEEGLKTDPFIVKFSGLAGYSHVANDNADLDSATVAGTHQHSASATNPYAPFLSKLDWEVARWAKLRGPGSTALSELTGIEGVSGGLSTEAQ